MIRTPIMPVMSPPVRNEIFLGAICEKSLAGLTTFAAIFVAKLARHKAGTGPGQHTRNVQRQRCPKTNHSGQRRKEKGKELARFRLTRIESGGLRENWSESTGSPISPPKKQ